MGFHICIVGYVFRIPVSLLWKPPNDHVIFIFNLTSTNSKLLHVKPVKASANRALSLHMSSRHCASRKCKLQTWRACGKLGLWNKLRAVLNDPKFFLKLFEILKT